MQKDPPPTLYRGEREGDAATWQRGAKIPDDLGVAHLIPRRFRERLEYPRMRWGLPCSLHSGGESIAELVLRLKHSHGEGIWALGRPLWLGPNGR